MTEHEGRLCGPYVTGIDKVAGQLYYWLSFTINFILPIVMLLVMNGFIIHVVNRSSKSQNEQETKFAEQDQSSNVKNSEKQIYVILLLVTFAFVIFITPSCILFIYVMLYDYAQSPRSFAFFNLFYHISHKTYYTNYGINFYLYVISGTKFRADLVNIFGLKKKEQLP